MRRLDGWNPRRETTHHYNRKGQLVRSVEWVESEWDALQAGWMLALAAYEATRCPVCGGDRDECWSKENWDRFEVPPPKRCHRATALARKQKDNEYTEPSALMWRAQLRR